MSLQNKMNKILEQNIKLREKRYFPELGYDDNFKDWIENLYRVPTTPLSSGCT